MISKIFVSQGTMELGRNRNKRRFDARESPLEVEYETENLPDGTKFCEYIDRCNLACFENTTRYKRCPKRKHWNYENETK